MSTILRVRGPVLEGTDNWNVGQVTVPRATFANPVLITPSDVNGSIELKVYLPSSSTPIYSTTFAKTLSQDGGVTQAIHAALVDSRWQGEDTIGHNFLHHVAVADLSPAALKGGRLVTFIYRIPTLLDGIVPAIFEWDMMPLHY